MPRVKHLFLDYSTAQTFKSCSRKFRLESIKQLEPAIIKDESLQANFKGTLVHASLDAISKGMKWEAVFDVLIAPNAAIRDIPDNRSGGIGHLKELLRRYQETYTPEPLITVKSEQSLQLPLTDRITAQGTVDKIVMRDGFFFVLDHKTSSNIRLYIEPFIPISDQFTGYIAFAQAQGYVVDSLIVDAISTAKKALDDNEGLFNRYETIRTTEQIEEWKTRMIRIGEEMIDFLENCPDFEENIVFPTPGCNAYGTKCQFWNVCSDSGAAQNILSTSYKKIASPWKNFKVIWE